MSFDFNIPSGTRILSIIILLAWVLHGIVLLSLSSEVIDTTSKGLQEFAYQNQESIRALEEKGLTDITVGDVESAVKRELQTVRAVHIVMTLLGFGAAAMAFFSVKLWRPAIVATSAIFLSVWYVSGPTAHVSLVEAYRLKWMMAETLDTANTFFIDDVILPFIFMSSVLYVVIEFLITRKQHVSS